jgi:hypothetical protein
MNKMGLVSSQTVAGIVRYGRSKCSGTVARVATVAIAGTVYATVTREEFPVFWVNSESLTTYL